MRIERMCQANLAVRKLGKVAVCKGGSFQIPEKPVIDMWTGCLDRVESQRRSTIEVGVKHANARIKREAQTDADRFVQKLNAIWPAESLRVQRAALV